MGPAARLGLQNGEPSKCLKRLTSGMSTSRRLVQEVLRTPPARRIFQELEVLRDGLEAQCYGTEATHVGRNSDLARKIPAETSAPAAPRGAAEGSYDTVYYGVLLCMVRRMRYGAWGA